MKTYQIAVLDVSVRPNNRAKCWLIQTKVATSHAVEREEAIHCARMCLGVENGWCCKQVTPRLSG